MVNHVSSYKDYQRMSIKASILTNLTVREFIVHLDTPKLRQGTLCVKHYSTLFIIEGFSEKIV